MVWAQLLAFGIATNNKTMLFFELSLLFVFAIIYDFWYSIQFHFSDFFPLTSQTLRSDVCVRAYVCSSEWLSFMLMVIDGNNSVLQQIGSYSMNIKIQLNEQRFVAEPKVNQFNDSLHLIDFVEYFSSIHTCNETSSASWLI